MISLATNECCNHGAAMGCRSVISNVLPQRCTNRRIDMDEVRAMQFIMNLMFFFHAALDMEYRGLHIVYTGLAIVNV